MSEVTKIPWCDSTTNFWEGCSKVSLGCQFCYAEFRDRRMMIEKVIHWGPGAPRRKSKSAVKQAVKMNRKPWICDNCGADFETKPERCDYCRQLHVHRRRIFSLSLGDWLDPEVPIEWLVEMLDTIRQCDKCNWLLLTKRPELWKARIEAALDSAGTMSLVSNDYPHKRLADLSWSLGEWRDGKPPTNIWIGTSIENQEAADKRIPELLKIPAAVRFLSVEPLLGPVDLSCPRNWLAQDTDEPNIHWVIVGGESGPNARPCHIEWIWDILEQCRRAQVPCFVKQLGACPVKYIETQGQESPFATSRIFLYHPKGGNPYEWPSELRVREFPRSEP